MIQTSATLGKFGVPIIKEGVRVLRPLEADALSMTIPKEGKKVGFSALLYGGLKYIEAQRLKENPGWLDPNGFIHLPEMKYKRTQKQRWVRLNPQGLKAEQDFLETRVGQLPTTQAWGQDLRRWAVDAGLNPVGLGPKTTRKTWESWLVHFYPERLAEITLSQGHTKTTSVEHYLNMPFIPSDKEAMRAYVDGMF